VTLLNAFIREPKIIFITISFGARESAVSIATHYELDGPAVESWLWRGFSHLSRLSLELIHPHVQWGNRSLSRG